MGSDHISKNTEKLFHYLCYTVIFCFFFILRKKLKKFFKIMFSLQCRLSFGIWRNANSSVKIPGSTSARKCWRKWMSQRSSPWCWFSTEAWCCSPLRAFQSQLDNRATFRLPCPLSPSLLHRHEEALLRLLALHEPEQADKYRAKVSNSTGERNIASEFWQGPHSPLQQDYTLRWKRGERLKTQDLDERIREWM